jgi:hypothetical protein
MRHLQVQFDKHDGELRHAADKILADAMRRLDRCHRCDSDQDLQSMRNILAEPYVRRAIAALEARDAN